MCLFLGYAPSFKGYVCLAPTGRVYISRHVFDDKCFPILKQPNIFSSTNKCNVSITIWIILL